MRLNIDKIQHWPLKQAKYFVSHHLIITIVKYLQWPYADALSALSTFKEIDATEEAIIYIFLWHKK